MSNPVLPTRYRSNTQRMSCSSCHSNHHDKCERKSKCGLNCDQITALSNFVLMNVYAQLGGNPGQMGQTGAPDLYELVQDIVSPSLDPAIFSDEASTPTSAAIDPVYDAEKSKVRNPFHARAVRGATARQ